MCYIVLRTKTIINNMEINNMYEDETGLILCHYCETPAVSRITGISDMYICNDEECAKACLFDNLGEESIEY